MISAELISGIEDILARDSYFELDNEPYEVVMTLEESCLVFMAVDAFGDFVAIAEFGVHALDFDPECLLEFVMFTVCDALEDSISQGGRSIYVFD